MNAKELLKKAKEFHGHICPFLALGVKASLIAMEELNVERVRDETIGEEILAIVECNNCFSDGIQIATGCTFGNNTLIYVDLGKNAFTLVRRKDWTGVRVYVDANKINDLYFDSEILELFDKVIVRREGSKDEEEKLSKLWEEIGWKVLDAPLELFKVEKVDVTPIERAPIFENVKCRICGELVMKTRVREGVCLKCSGEYYAVIGRGIVKFERGRYREVVL